MNAFYKKSARLIAAATLAASLSLGAQAADPSLYE